MDVTEKHPDYNHRRECEWETMRDVWQGESRIKERHDHYLPRPEGWKHHADRGDLAYRQYIQRARFPGFTAQAIRSMVGVLHGQPWHVQLPPALDYMRERATLDGLPMEVFSRRITTELLITGRYCVLADAPPNGGDPYLAGYGAEALTNWDVLHDFYALSECARVRNGFKWGESKRVRALHIEDGIYVQDIYDNGDLMARTIPTARGGKPLTQVPISVGGAMDMDLCPDAPPLIGVARAAISHYQLNADYRMALYMAYQDTLVVYNAAEPPKAVGAGVVMSLTSAENGKEAKAEYIAPSGQSIEAHERAMDREYSNAARSGAQLFNSTSSAQESGDARRLRFSAETASLATIAGSSAAILERALRHAAVMAGADPQEVIVTPPKNLLDGKLEPTELQALVAAWQAGAFSTETLYENLQRGRIASMDRDLAAETALKDAEAAGTPAPDAGL